MPGTFELKRAAGGGGQYTFNLKAANGEKILTSETYVSKSGATKGIESVRVNAPNDARYERKTSSAREPYFVLKAGNGEILGRSEMYSSTQAMERGIASVKANAPSAVTQDLT